MPAALRFHAHHPSKYLSHTTRCHLGFRCTHTYKYFSPFLGTYVLNLHYYLLCIKKKLIQKIRIDYFPCVYFSFTRIFPHLLFMDDRNMYTLSLPSSSHLFPARLTCALPSAFIIHRYKNLTLSTLSFIQNQRSFTLSWILLVIARP